MSQKTYKWITRVAFIALLALSLYILPLVYEVFRVVASTTERAQTLTTRNYMFTVRPTVEALLTICSAWALTFVIGQISLMLRRSNTQNIFVRLLRAKRDERPEISVESAKLLRRDEYVRAGVLGVFSAAVAYAVRVVPGPTLCLIISIACIVVFAIIWKLTEKRGSGVRHLAFDAIVGFLTSYAIGWSFGIQALLLYQILNIALIVIATIIAQKQTKRYAGQDEESSAPDTMYVSLNFDESGSINKQNDDRIDYTSDIIESGREIVGELSRSGRKIFIQLNTFGVNGFRPLCGWRPAIEALEYVNASKNGFASDYRAGGGTPINHAIISSKEELIKRPDQGSMPVSIFVTDGNPTDDGWERLARGAVSEIEGDTMKGVFAIAGVGHVDPRYLERMTTSRDRFGIFRRGHFREAARGIVAGIFNIAKGGRTAQFFPVTR